MTTASIDSSVDTLPFSTLYFQSESKKSVHIGFHNECTSALSKKYSKFPRYNMKCRGKWDNTWNILHTVVSQLPLDSVLTVHIKKNIYKWKQKNC